MRGSVAAAVLFLWQFAIASAVEEDDFHEHIIDAPKLRRSLGSSALENRGTTALTILIPLIAGLTGWVTNVLALHFTFYPLEFIGCFKPFLGWQGIIPSRAKEMAEISTDLIQKNLLAIHEVFGNLSPDDFAQHCKPTLDKQVREAVDFVAHKNVPDVWAKLPVAMKEDVYASVAEQSPTYLALFIRKLQLDIERVFDLKAMVVETLTEDKDLINHIFLTCGAPEFAFIKRSGFYFGFLFGLLQMTAWIFYTEAWILPVFGFIVEPIYLCGDKIKLHGLFLKRQIEVAENYSQVVQDKVLTADRLVNSLLHGPGKRQVDNIILECMSQAVDDYVGAGQSLLTYTVGTNKYERLKKDFAAQMNKGIPEVFHSAQEYLIESLHVRQLLKERMENMTSAAFEQLLHPVFEQDEWKLILLGGVLGCAIGGVQAGLSEAASA